MKEFIELLEKQSEYAPSDEYVKLCRSLHAIQAVILAKAQYDRKTARRLMNSLMFCLWPPYSPYFVQKTFPGMVRSKIPGTRRFARWWAKSGDQ